MQHSSAVRLAPFGFRSASSLRPVIRTSARRFGGHARQSTRKHPWNATSPLTLAAGVTCGVVSYLAIANGFKQVYQPVYADSAPEVLESVAAKADLSQFEVDSATQIPFPISLETIAVPNNLKLIGKGVRTISFLRVKVYCAGFYLEEACLKELKTVDGWSTFSEKKLLTAPEATSDEIHGEALMSNLLSLPVACAVRIVPTRNTDFGHLKDAFIRSLTARQKEAVKAQKLTPEEDERITESIQEFKSFFPKNSIPKGAEVLLVRANDGSLSVEFEGKTLGTTQDKWVAKGMMLIYFADKNPSSPILKKNVAQTLERVVQGEST